jgi:peptide/nickel transport system permease protein
MTVATTTPGAPTVSTVPRRALRRILYRIAGAVFVLWAVASLSFFIIHLIPGDPALAIVGGGGTNVTQAVLDRARHDYGLDQPLYVQYFVLLGHLFTGDLGSSYALKEPVITVISDHLGSTLLLTALSLALAWILALALAIWVTQGGRIARAVGSTLEIIAAALPQFWLAAILILIFAVSLRWLPATTTPSASSFVLPVITLAIPLAGFLGQVMRESMLDALESPFVLSARARGESEFGVRWIHAIRHAALPGISLSGWAFGSLISGAVVVETIFARDGLGRSLLAAVLGRDVPVVTGVLLTIALIYIVVNILAEVAYVLVDPRTKTVS